jgi:hypothetical protein
VKHLLEIQNTLNLGSPSANGVGNSDEEVQRESARPLVLVPVTVPEQCPLLEIQMLARTRSLGGDASVGNPSGVLAASAGSSSMSSSTRMTRHRRGGAGTSKRCCYYTLWNLNPL